MEHIRILLLGVSFRVYISYKIRTRQKSGKDWKSGNGRNAWSPQRVHFSDWFFQEFVLDNANSQMYQSHKTLRLRRGMSLPLTFIQPFRANPQSCPFFYMVILYMSYQNTGEATFAGEKNNKNWSCVPIFSKASPAAVSHAVTWRTLGERSGCSWWTHAPHSAMVAMEW